MTNRTPRLLGGSRRPATLVAVVAAVAVGGVAIGLAIALGGGPVDTTTGSRLSEETVAKGETAGRIIWPPR